MELAEETIDNCSLKMKPGQFLRLVSLKKMELEDKDSSGRLDDFSMGDYRKRMTERNLLDFDDLLTETLKLLQEKKKKNCEFPFLLADEFQDINPVQYQLLQAWNHNGKELFVIGDPDQSIYGFRGADGTCFQRLSEEDPKLCRIYLTENYRSAPEILEGAVSLIAHNPGPERILLPRKAGGLRHSSTG